MISIRGGCGGEPLWRALFSAIDTERFDVRFKLHAPNGAVVEAACVDGQLSQLVVSPPTNVTVIGCSS